MLGLLKRLSRAFGAVTNNGDVLPAFASGSIEVRFQEFTSLGTIPHELLVEGASIDGVDALSKGSGAVLVGDA